MAFPCRFHAEGNRIVDADGNVRVFRGLNAIHPITQATPGNKDCGTWNESYYAEMRKWGADIVRVPVSPRAWRENPNIRLEILDRTVDWIGKQGMYAILDFHSIGFLPDGFFPDLGYSYHLSMTTTVEEAREFWETISRRYAGNDVVAFYEIFNEPVTAGQVAGKAGTERDWLRWREMSEGFINTIRAYDDHKPIIASGLDYTYDLSFVPDHPIRRENIIYAVHIYPNRKKKDWDRMFGRTAQRYPVFCTEWGFVLDPKHAHASYSLETVYGPEGLFRRDIVDCLEQRGISWTVWCFGANWGPDLLADWKLNPNAGGVYVREQLLAHRAERHR